ncbi:cyclic nucleotide-binding protein [Azonexus hydrophilus]|uniref:Cyclic nucleotide-binding protein n=1 Tax=Azonexus hydrophilus TaxID=418702 RepID=A0A1R1I7B3_9RHOO|nr:SIMPL domain-containing protein [Azonexus hydrophilus]OMG54605.1 cyclic nucleotide-binding protein [Azonexus hydrophilus]
MKSLPVLLFSLTLMAASVQAATTVDLAAEASRPAVNDQVRAVVYSEGQGSNPAEIARRVNQEIAGALQLIRGKAGVSVKSGNQSTYPVYGRDQKIESWRMRSELVLESRDLGAVSDLLGELQQRRLAVGNVSQMPSPETRRQVEDEATRDAIKAFQERAAVIAGALGKRWTIKQLSVSQQGGAMPMPIYRSAKVMMAEAAPAPLEAGESLLTTTVSGQIELAD